MSELLTGFGYLILGVALPKDTKLHDFAQPGKKRHSQSHNLLQDTHQHSKWNPTDENFVVKHNHRGVLSLVNAGPNTNHTAFMILFKPMEYFDRKYVAIGQMIDGVETLTKMEGVETEFEKPKQVISIVAAGVHGK